MLLVWKMEGQGFSLFETLQSASWMSSSNISLKDTHYVDRINKDVIMKHPLKQVKNYIYILYINDRFICSGNCKGSNLIL